MYPPWFQNLNTSVAFPAELVLWDINGFRKGKFREDSSNILFTREVVRDMHSVWFGMDYQPCIIKVYGNTVQFFILLQSKRYKPDMTLSIKWLLCTKLKCLAGFNCVVAFELHRMTGFDIWENCYPHCILGELNPLCTVNCCKAAKIELPTYRWKNIYWSVYYAL